MNTTAPSPLTAAHVRDALAAAGLPATIEDQGHGIVTVHVDRPADRLTVLGFTADPADPTDLSAATLAPLDEVGAVTVEHVDGTTTTTDATWITDTDSDAATVTEFAVAAARRLTTT